MTEREKQRQRFLRDQQLGDVDIVPLQPDASFRRYFRLQTENNPLLLMDAPPNTENTAQYISIDQHLASLGVRVPAIHAQDLETGFAILEDMGDSTFTQLLKRGHQESELYLQAVNTLIQLQSHPETNNIDLQQYDYETLLTEVSLFIDWYLPACTGQIMSQTARAEFVDSWQQIYTDLPHLKTTFVHRDYHIDNLMMVGNQCAMLDFQDALLGSPAYDLVSILEDARRDVSLELQRQLKDHFIKSLFHEQSDALMHHYTVWGIQRHCKVAGIFVRLWVRDNKASYLAHLPRVLDYIRQSIAAPYMAPLALWFQEYFPGLTHEPFIQSHATLKNLLITETPIRC